MQIRKYSLFIIIFFITIPLHSQFNTYSPYTRFGLGDLARNGFGQNHAMGGTGIAIHEGNRINYLNPASFSSLDSTSVYFDFGANTFHNQYQTEKFSNTWWNMNLHHVAFASSMGKYLGFSVGIVPYSSIGYNIKQEYDDFSAGAAMDTYYKGDGGIMNFYLGGSVKFFDQISLGVTMNYLMGRLTRERKVEFPVNPTYSPVSSLENFDLRHPVFSFGLQYKKIIKDKFFFTLGGVYDLKANVGATLKYNVVNSIYPYESIELNDSVTVDPNFILAQDTTLRNFIIPQKVGVGIALGIPNKLTITADYYMQDWTGTLSGENYNLTNASSMHFGTEYTPDAEALRGYHKLITYRMGGYYSNYYLQVNGHQLEDYGITFGLGLPVRTVKSTINVAFTLGTRGTTEYHLVKENYGIVTFNVTLHDLWFRKRRFD
ncbi:MAG: hypothetical protein KAR19_03280 [Bacteroidales bacterium]|nr:hypothetical protein [Bacteroidales bacterium]